MTVPIKWIRELLRVSLYRNAGYLMLASGVNSLAGFVFWAVAARLYPAEGVGLAAAAISAIGLLALLSTLGMDYGLIRFLPGSGDKAKNILNSCFTLSGLVSVALAVIFLAGLKLWSPALLRIQQNPVFFISFVIFALAAVYRVFAERTFIAGRRAGFALTQGLVFNLLRFIPLVALAPLFNVFGIFASWGIGLGLAVIVSIPFLIPRVQPGYRPAPKIDRKSIGNMMHFSFANYGANIFWAIPILCLPLMVVNLLGAEANAYFYIGWALGYLLVSIPVTVSFSLFAEGSHSEEQLGHNIDRSLRLLLVLVPVIAIVFLAGERVLALFGSAYAENATTLLWVLAVSAIPVGLNHTYFTVKRVQKRMRGVIGLSAFIAVVTMVLSYLLLPRVGIIGAGISWLIPQAIVAVAVTPSLLRWRHQSVVGIEQQRSPAYRKGLIAN
ncbi:MAG TPA: oligosaccharide flippase family protein [Dehalococcoidales bacterium]|nr:oligosaccharide flippase family protein [Dehalococcoidales bacterium]